MKKTTRFLALCLTFLLSIAISKSAFAQGKTSTEANEISNEALKEYLGQYDPGNGQGFSITVSLDGEDRLMAQPTNKSQPLTLLRAKGKDQFSLVNTGGLEISFTRDENDKVISLTFSSSGQTFTAKRKED